LSGQAGAVQSRVIERRDAFGGHRTGDLLEPCVGSASRCERDLLLEDDLDERLEPRRAVPERWRAVTGDDRGEVRIPPGELGNALRERRGGQLKRHVNLTSSGAPV
jgi:hypothetical protein